MDNLKGQAGKVNTDTQVTSLFRPSNAPCWQTALDIFEKEHPRKYRLFEASFSNVDRSCLQKWNDHFEPTVPKTYKTDATSHSWVQRVKAYHQFLGPLRAVAMAASRTDPLFIAPIVCAVVFSTVEIVLGLMKPEDRNAMLDITFESAIAMNEWISFEVRFVRKAHPRIKDKVHELNELLPKLYVQALQLLSSIQKHCHAGGIKRRVDNLFSMKIVKWKDNFGELQRQRLLLSSIKKDIDDKLAADESCKKVLKWIQKEGDPEEELDSHMKKASSEGKYNEYGLWLFDLKEFRGWANGFQILKSKEEKKQALWIHGNYGTGKSTLVCRVVSNLQALAANRSPENDIRIVPYFCKFTGPEKKGLDFETIIRSLAMKLSWTPEFTVALPAQTSYDEHTTPKSNNSVPAEGESEWKKLLEDLINDISKDSVVVFLVDALDECSNVNSNQLLNFMAERMKASPNVQFLCSSRQHLQVGRWLEESLLYDLEVSPAMTRTDMERLVRAEIESRRPKPYKEGESVFFSPDPKHQNLLAELEKSLLDNAQGMFVWVKLWLGILLPEWANPIQFDVTAEKKLQELRECSKSELDPEFKTVYQRLWDVHQEGELAEYQPRLFHLFLCSIRSPTTNYVTSALRIRADSFNDQLTSRHVKHLFANFLVEDSKGHLQFAHATAKNFILSMNATEESSLPGGAKMFDARRNHLSVADSCLILIGDLDHQAWKDPFLSSSHGSLMNVKKQKNKKQKYVVAEEESLDDWNIEGSMETVLENVSEMQEKLLHIPLNDWYDKTAMETLGFKPRFPLAEAQGKDCFAVYALFFWWHHFWEVHQNEMISHEGWIKFFDTVIFPPRSAFFASILALFEFLSYSPYSPGGWHYYPRSMRNRLTPFPPIRSAPAEIFSPGHIVEKSRVGMKLLVLHALAYLFPIEDGWARLSDVDLKAFAESKGNLEGGRLKCLLQVVRTQNAVGIPALHTSCSLTNSGVVKLLLQGTRLSEGEGAAMALLVDRDATGRIALEQCFNKGMVGQAVAELLLRFEKEQKAPCPEGRQLAQLKPFNHGRNVLLEALECAEESVALLCVRYAVPDEYELTDDENNTALHIAVQRNFFTVITELVETCNAEVDAPNLWGFTPLTHAMQHGNFDIIKYLLDHSRTKVDQMIGILNESLLHIAARQGLVAVMTQLVEKCNANIMVKNVDEETPLFCALRSGRLNAVDYLLRCPRVNLDSDNLDRGKNSLLHIAAQMGVVTLMTDLVKSHGADVNATNIKGETPLLLALHGKQLDAADFLLGCPGIDPDWQSIHILSAMRLALESLGGGNFRSGLERSEIGRYGQLAAMMENTPSTVSQQECFSSVPPLQHELAGWRILWVLSIMVIFVACFVTFWSGWLQSSS